MEFNETSPELFDIRCLYVDYSHTVTNAHFPFMSTTCAAVACMLDDRTT